MSKPAPFQRPSIDLGRHGRSWQEVPVSSLNLQDIVANFGQVVRITPHEAEKDVVYLTFFGGKFGMFNNFDVVLAFIRGGADENART